MHAASSTAPISVEYFPTLHKAQSTEPGFGVVLGGAGVVVGGAAVVDAVPGPEPEPEPSPLAFSPELEPKPGFGVVVGAAAVVDACPLHPLYFPLSHAAQFPLDPAYPALQSHIAIALLPGED